MSVYLDASILVPRLVEEPASDAVRRYLDLSRQERLISDFAAAEVASGLSRLIRTGLLAKSDAAARLEDFDGWRAATSSPVDFHPVDARLALNFVRRFELMLRAPDALHLAIVRRLDTRLVTLDRRLANAARALGITVEMPQPDPMPR